MPYVTFVHATFILVTFVHISNIWPNFNQTFWTEFLRVKINFDPHFVRHKLLGSKSIWIQNDLEPRILLGSNIFLPNLFWIQNLISTQFFYPKLVGSKTFWTHNLFGDKFFFDLSAWFFMIQPKYNQQNNTIFFRVWLNWN